MEPVVNGLAVEFGNEIEFRHIDANSTEGLEVFRYFGLRGHPSYVILNPNSEILWQGLGEQSRELIREQIELAIGE